MSLDESIADKNGNKKICTKIGTHNGHFHCDEALACFLLKQLPQYKDSQIIRSRDPAQLNQCDIVVDVGGVYDPEQYRFDHHQKSFNHTFSSINPSKPWDIKLSSAGLIYVHFGEQVLDEVLTKISKHQFKSEIEREKFIKILYDKIYEEFVREIDAIDNGINIADEKRYDITTNLSARVGFLNPQWNDEDVDENVRFQNAVELVGREFIDRVEYYTNVWWSARSIVEDAIKTRFEVDSSGEILKIDSYAPWKAHLFALEKELSIEPNSIKFVLYSDNSGNWRIQCVPINERSFTNRLSMPEEWRGLRDEELCKKTQISDCIFVHANGFIGAAKSYEGVLQMGRKSLKSLFLEKQRRLDKIDETNNRGINSGES